jgi:hypothetical protein
MHMPKPAKQPTSPITPDQPIPTQPAPERKGDSFDPVDWLPLQDFRGMTLEQAMEADKFIRELKGCLSNYDAEIMDCEEERKRYRRAIWRRERAIRNAHMQLGIIERRVDDINQSCLALKHAIEYRKQALRLVVNREMDPSKLQPRYDL